MEPVGPGPKGGPVEPQSLSMLRFLVESPVFLRSDLSHAIHGDNCVFKNGRCDKRFPAYTWRDYR